MIHIENIRDGLPIYEALDSEVRVAIIELLLENKSMNLNDMSKRLGITNGAITAHIKKLENAGLISIRSVSGVRGSQKMCTLKDTKIIIEVSKISREYLDFYESEIAIGHYTKSSISPTCGIVTQEHIIGELDDPRYFSFPERFEASLLWFTKGYVEYQMPNSLKFGETPTEIQLSLEIASEAPGCSEHYPSDIYFSINGVELGYWTSPGEFNDRAGIFTPSWWFPNLGQYGKLKLLTINGSGSFIDGLKISDVTCARLALDYKSVINFRLSSPEKAANPGGVTLFGKGFGDYNSGITMKMFYEKAQKK